MSSQSSRSSSSVTGQFSDPSSVWPQSQQHPFEITVDPRPLSTQSSSHSIAVFSDGEGQNRAVSPDPDLTPLELTVCLTDSCVQRMIQRILQQHSPADMDVLQIRRSFSEGTVPDTRQLNRVLYSLADAGLIVKLEPQGRSLRPRWAMI